MDFYARKQQTMRIIDNSIGKKSIEEIIAIVNFETCIGERVVRTRINQLIKAKLIVRDEESDTAILRWSDPCFENKDIACDPNLDLIESMGR